MYVQREEGVEQKRTPCDMIVFLPLNILAFFTMRLLIGYLKTYPIETGGKIGKNAYATGGGSSNFCPFGAYILTE